MDSDLLLQRVEGVLGEAFPKLKNLGADDYFVDFDVLTSFEIIELSLTIESKFGLKIPDLDVTEENFGSKRAIANYLGSRLSDTTA